MAEQIVSDESYNAILNSHFNPIPSGNIVVDEVTRCADCKWVKEDDGFDNSCSSPKRCSEAIDNLKKAWQLIRDNDPFTMYDQIGDSSLFETLRESMDEIVRNGLPIPECPFNQKCYEASQWEKEK